MYLVLPCSPFKAGTKPCQCQLQLASLLFLTRPDSARESVPSCPGSEAWSHRRVPWGATRRGQLTWLRVVFSSPTDVITVSEKTVCPVWLLVLYNRTGTVRVKQKGLWANPTTFLLFPEAGEPRQTPSLPSRQRNSLPRSGGNRAAEPACRVATRRDAEPV